MFGLLTLLISSILYIVGFIRTPKLLVLNKLRTINELLYLGKIPDIMGIYSSPFIKATYEGCGINTITEEICISQPMRTNNQKILLVGDSHAGHLIPLLGNLHKDYGFGTIVSTHGLYPPKHYTNKFGFNLISSQERFERTKREFENKLNYLIRMILFFYQED